MKQVAALALAAPHPSSLYQGGGRGVLMLCDGRRAVGGRRAARGAGPGAGPTARPEPAAGTCQPEPLATYVLIYVITPQTTYDSGGVRRAPTVWASLYSSRVWRHYIRLDAGPMPWRVWEVSLFPSYIEGKGSGLSLKNILCKFDTGA